VRTERGSGPSRTSSAIAEGTVFTRVTSPSGSEGSARALSASTTRPPRASGTNSSQTERSKLSEVAASVPSRSAAGNARSDQRTSATALRCSIATPLGRPVEPLV